MLLDVWSVPVTGGGPTLELRHATYPMGLPGGDICFVNPASGPGPYVIGVADDAGTRRTLVESSTDIWSPRLSPDGTRILYPSDEGWQLVDASTGESHRLPHVVTGADGASWLGDDTLVVTPGS